MKPNLLIGLGNPLMGDEGIAWHLVERLPADPGLPPDVEVMWGGSDLLRSASFMQGRKQVIVLDAMFDPGQPGTLHVFEDDFTVLDGCQPSAHQLSAVESIRLLRATDKQIERVQFRLFAVGISSAGLQPGLSQGLQAKLPGLVDEILSRLR